MNERKRLRVDDVHREFATDLPIEPRDKKANKPLGIGRAVDQYMEEFATEFEVNFDEASEKAKETARQFNNKPTVRIPFKR